MYRVNEKKAMQYPAGLIVLYGAKKVNPLGFDVEHKTLGLIKGATQEDLKELYEMGVKYIEKDDE